MTHPTPDARTWLLSLHGLAQAWAAALPHASPTARTPAYIDLIFAFGLGRLGADELARSFAQLAREALVGEDEAHTFLFHAYRHRIVQATEGQPHAGPLPAAMMESLDLIERLVRYVVDRLRKHSRILEPEQRVNPSRHWGARISDFEKALADLTDLTDRNEIQSRVEKLLRDVPEGARGDELRARVLRDGLEAAPRVGVDFARRLLEQTIPTYDALPKPKELATLIDQATFLEKAIFVAGHFCQLDLLRLLIERSRVAFRRFRDPQSLPAIERLLTLCIQSLVDANQPELLDEMLGELRDLLLRGRNVEEIDFRREAHGAAFARVLLRLCRGWFAFGFDTLADPVLDRVRGFLLLGELPPREQGELACAYLAAAGHAPREDARTRLEDVFHHLKGIRDTYTSQSHFAVSQLEVVEAAVLAALQAHGHGID
jgi:hypothetical protein